MCIYIYIYIYSYTNVDSLQGSLGEAAEIHRQAAKLGAETVVKELSFQDIKLPFHHNSSFFSIDTFYIFIFKCRSSSSSMTVVKELSFQDIRMIMIVAYIKLYTEKSKLEKSLILLIILIVISARSSASRTSE